MNDETPATQVEFARESLPPELILNPPPQRARRRPEVGFRYGDRTVRWHDPAAMVIRQREARLVCWCVISRAKSG